MSFKTLGCKVNQVETEQTMARLLRTGFEVVNEESADVVVVNTCTVTGEADTKARKAVRHALHLPQTPSVVVTGCLASLEAEELKGLGDRVIVEPDTARVAERVAELAPYQSQAAHAVAPCDPARSRAGGLFRTRAMVKIEDGCDAFCSYCIVPHARGGPRSVPATDVVRECADLVAAGVTEIVLTGINLGRYSHEATDLASLVEQVAVTGVRRLRLSSIEPLDLTERVLAALRSSECACPHLHVPLQSGDDSVLARMSRTYSTAAYAARIARAREALPGLAVTTDVIAGFPGETAEEAARTLRFCEETGFARLHVFRFSARSGTVAAGLSEQVDPRVRASRAAQLRELDSTLRRAYAGSRAGQIEELLVERVGSELSDATLFAEGTTPDYLRVRAELADGRVARSGDTLRVRLGQLVDGVVRGEVCQ